MQFSGIHPCFKSKQSLILTFVWSSIFVVMLIANSQSADSASQQIESSTTTPDWLEPQGLSLIQAVGQIPESVLKDVIVKFNNLGIMQYISGVRNGDYVTITVSNESSDPNLIHCLGDPGTHDEYQIVVPEAKMRVYSNGNDVTDRAIATYELYPAGRNLPIKGSSGGARYASSTETVAFTDDGRVIIPANRGCTIFLSGATLTNVTVEFEFYSPPKVSMSIVFVKDATRPSYIHPTSVSGALGQYADLNAELHAYNDKYNREDGTVARLSDIAKLQPWGRNDAINANSGEIAGSEFVLAKFPPAPFHGFLSQPANASNPIRGGGSYRINSGAPDFLPSVDIVDGMLAPLYGNWIDADRSRNATWLGRYDRPRTVTVPEIIAPPGMAYNSCMPNGGSACPDSVLRAIFNYSLPIELYYIKVERIGGGLEQIPLKAVGPAWSPSRSETESSVASPMRGLAEYHVYLPIVMRPEAIPDDVRSPDCPCGWFDSDGIMYDIVLPP